MEYTKTKGNTTSLRAFIYALKHHKDSREDRRQSASTKNAVYREKSDLQTRSTISHTPSNYYGKQGAVDSKKKLENVE